MDEGRGMMSDGKTQSASHHPSDITHHTSLLSYLELLVSSSVMPREYQFPFELRHLVYFREVARQLHFRKAAEALAIAQPALSRAVAQLETALDADLLNRTRRRAEVTPAGKLLLDQLEPLLR